MKMIMEFMNNFIDTVSGVLYQPWCVPLLLLVGGSFSPSFKIDASPSFYRMF